MTPFTEVPRDPDCFMFFPERSAQPISDELIFEPVVVATTNAHSWAQQGTRQALDQLIFVSPAASTRQNQVLPTSIAFMMAKSNRQRGPSILERYAPNIPLSASCHSVQKHCMFPDCTKMSVSKGLCRGHGGGRRCHFAGGCTKSAQSRSMFCWAHGGGQRCDVDTCMRSRKSKHYCVAHMHLESDDYGHTASFGKSPRVPRTRRSRYVPVPTQVLRKPSQQLLPSLGQALSAASLSLPSFPIFPQVRARCLSG
ncbi:hypothetical protein JG687_00009377 [Phytophthora cactorum]|uniref:WRKY19-like zinc finger domain-containing protein n=2 Tax=Phytophthora cactorum TaxID=29920 RepID=A0A8T1UA21_9STRA|nr:hypothetical protein GQ600_22755 [Phytophthora cactorum]KAG6958465.1 hypothetical protein JG687_00009377 [Phytophthora cactorum]